MSHVYRHHTHAPYERLASQFRARRPHTGIATTCHPGPTDTPCRHRVGLDWIVLRTGLPGSRSYRLRYIRNITIPVCVGESQSKIWNLQPF